VKRPMGRDERTMYENINLQCDEEEKGETGKRI
jgi:hypothetical protein